MKNPLSDLETLRGRIFFWVGLLILPVFWVWWMRPANFSRWQRQTGLVWTVCYMVLSLVLRVPLENGFGNLIYSYPALAFQLTLGLGVWLMLRVFQFSVKDVFYWLLFLVLGIPGFVAFVLRGVLPPVPPMAPQHNALIIFVVPVIVAALHLLLEPCRQGFASPLWRRVT